MLVALPLLTWDMFLRDIGYPLSYGDPIVRVNYAYYAVPALALGCMLVAMLIIVGHLRQRLRVPRRRMMPFVKCCTMGLWVCLGMFVALPVIGGLATERYAQRHSYEYCRALFELGVGTYSRGYVKDPRLCVAPSAIESALDQYGYNDALRRYRFEFNR